VRAKDVIGRKIVRVRQGMVSYNGGLGNAVDEIELEDGTLLRFVTLELESDYATNVVVVKPQR